MIFQPVLPWSILVLVVLLLLGGCLVLAVLTPARRARWLLRAGVVVVLGTALARPGVPQESLSQTAASAVDVFIVVDTTASMVAEDWDGAAPRLDGVKQDMQTLLDQLPGARVSMVTFDSSAAVRVPLTTDHSAFASAIETLGPEITIYSGGSSVTEAKDMLVDRLATAQEQNPENAQLVYYFGDGEQTTSAEPQSMAEVGAAIAGGAVFGYGTNAGGPMKETRSYYSQEGDPQYIRDPSTSQPAVSRIDEQQLRNIAGGLGVDYHHRTAAQPLSAEYTAPSFDEVLIDREVLGGITEFFWIPLLAVFAWIVAEAAFGMHRIRTLHRLHASLQEAQ